MRHQGAPHEEKPSTEPSANPPADAQPRPVSTTALADVPSADRHPDISPVREHATARRPARATAHRTPKRRKRNDANPLDDQLTFRCHSEDKVEIKRRAKAAELATAVYVVRKALADDHADIATRDERLDAAIDEVAALRTQVAMLGNNVNQLTATTTPTSPFRLAGSWTPSPRAGPCSLTPARS
ncbi:plasmid mobilization protein [Kitasatospora sp. CMC57]|uniref:plasmid mobilization protein n=1 Tax=Kitasatospora sp. CMC57 TaxID=3231513 RepID=UPI0038B46BFD